MRPLFRRRAKFGPIVALTALMLVLFPGPTAAKTDGRAASVKAKQLDVIAEMDALDHQLSRLATRLRALDTEKNRLAEAVRQADREEIRLTEAQQKRRVKLTARLKAIYLHGDRGLAQSVVGAPNLIEAYSAWQGLLKVVRFDLKMIKDYNGLVQSLSRAERERLVRRTELDNLAVRLKQVRAELLDRRGQRAKLLLALEDKRRDYRRATEQLDQTARQLGRRVDELPRSAEAEGVTGLDGQTGRLPWPVNGSISKPAGLDRPGVLIAAQAGRPVKAVAAGRVVYAGWVKGYGLVVIIDHGHRYYTLSGHLEELKVAEGQAVEAGQTLGLVGRAGLSEAGVYFEIRHRKQAQDPRLWLAGAR